MTWFNLGTVQPIYEWRGFDFPAINTTLFRITQTWNGDFPGVGPIQLRGIYANGGRYGFRRFFSNTEPLLMLIPTPADLIAAGYLVRDMQIRLGGRTRFYEDANWRVTLETWTGEADAQGNPVQRISGGTYVGT